MGKFRKETSSGGVLYRLKEGILEVALILRTTQKGKKVWCLPKGKVEKAESPEETALREVREETGMEGEIVQKLGSINYWFHSPEDKAKVHKTVHFYLMKYLSGSPQEHDWEVEDVSWFNLKEALALMAYETEKEIVQRLREFPGGFHSEREH